MSENFERDPLHNFGWLIFIGIVCFEVWACQNGHAVIAILSALVGLLVGGLLLTDFQLVIKPLHIAIRKMGFEFRYHGDDVMYIWPWKRPGLFPNTVGKRKWYSHSFLACYRTLKELDKEWAEYEKACKEQW